MKNLKTIIPAGLILAAVLLSFYPVLKNNFTDWDDNLYVTQNKVIRSISPSSLANISTHFFVTHYQPLTLFSYMLEYKAFKLNPFGYHLDNLLLHLFNCILVYWLIYLLSKGSIPVALLTTLLFGIHPLQVETVAWVAERKNLLYAFFYLGALISYLNYHLKKDKKYFYLCLALFVFSLLSKSMAITLPLALLLFDYCRTDKLKLSSVIQKTPFFVLSISFGLLALLGGYLTKSFYNERTVSLLDKLKGASSDIIFYLNKLFYPVKLSILYPYTEVKSGFYLFYVLIVVTLLALVIFSNKYTKKIILGAGLFLLILFPVIRSLPLDDIIFADRYVYLASIGLFYLFSEALVWVWTYSKNSPVVKGIIILLLSLCLICFGYLTNQRTRVWKDDSSLWNNVLAIYPGSTTAHKKRGEYYFFQQDYDRAREDFEKAIEISKHFPFRPEFRYYYLNLGYALRASGRNKEAMAVFEQVIKDVDAFNVKAAAGKSDKSMIVTLYRRYIETNAYSNLASLNDILGNDAKAEALYLKALELNPRQLYVHENLGALYAKEARIKEAIKEFNQVIDIEPTQLSAYFQLDDIYQAFHDQKNLEALYQKAVSNNLDFFQAYYYLAELSFDKHQEAQAIRLYKRALLVNPSSKEAALGLGNAYLTLGDPKGAIRWLNQALKFDPKLAVAHNNLALAYYYTKQYPLALEHSDQAIKLGYPESLKLLKLLESHRNKKD